MWLGVLAEGSCDVVSNINRLSEAEPMGIRLSNCMRCGRRIVHGDFGWYHIISGDKECANVN